MNMISSFTNPFSKLKEVKYYLSENFIHASIFQRSKDAKR